MLLTLMSLSTLPSLNANTINRTLKLTMQPHFIAATSRIRCAFANPCRRTPTSSYLARHQIRTTSFQTKPIQRSTKYQHNLHASSNGEDKVESTYHTIPTEQTILPGCTTYDALKKSLSVLKQHNSPEPEESALYLLSHAIDLSWETGYRQLRDVLQLTFLPHNVSSVNGVSSVHNLALQQLTDEQTTLFASFIERRKKYEPIQYIIGKWDFHQLSGLSIRRPMLCPRPETEELVEILLAEIEELIHKRGKKDKGSNGRIRILDVGAGTGAIGIAIAHQLPHHVQVLALDVLPEAVELSNENAQQFLSKFVDSDVGDVSSVYKAVLCPAKEFNAQSQQYPMNFDLVVSNPPYIPSSDMPSLSTDILDYESVEALCGGDDGLDVIRDIVQRLPEWMPRKDEEKRYCWMEVDDSHPSLLESWLAPGSSESKRWSVEYCESRNDFCGRSRFVKLRVIE